MEDERGVGQEAFVKCPSLERENYHSILTSLQTEMVFHLKFILVRLNVCKRDGRFPAVWLLCSHTFRG